MIITDCPILVWMMSLNREYTLEVRAPRTLVDARLTFAIPQEYNSCYEVVKECLPHVKRIKNDPENPDTFRASPLPIRRPPC